MSSLLFFLVPAAAAASWYAGYKQQHQPHSGDANKKKPTKPFSRDYFLGLNYLINEEPDKAIDVFIKMLDVNDDTVETHLALGALFRRRGEVDRAIRVHQNIIARAHLEKEQKVHALSELGLDYLRSGLLDRAENLFLELINMGEEVSPSYHYLLNIYQLQKEWEKAIQIAKKLAKIAPESEHLESNVGHYYCELAEAARKRQDFTLANNLLKKALSCDKNSARASILLGDLARDKQQFTEAIKHYQLVKTQDPRYLSEIANALNECYTKNGDPDGFIDFFTACLAENYSVELVVAVTDKLVATRGPEVAAEFLVNELKRALSLRAVERLLDIYQQALPESHNRLQLVQDFMRKLLEKNPNYRCSKCGFATKALYWQCPSCKNWSTMAMVETVGA